MLNKNHPIYKFLVSQIGNKVIKTFEAISSNREKEPRTLVNCQLNGIDFDLVSDYYLYESGDNVRSTDCLVFQNDIYLIEFKRNIRDDYKKLIIKEKMLMSLIVLEKIIFNYCELIRNDLNIHYIIVVDSSVDGDPRTAYQQRFGKRANNYKSIKESFSHYVKNCKIRRVNQKLLYDKIHIWDEQNFKYNIQRIE